MLGDFLLAMFGTSAAVFGKSLADKLALQFPAHLNQMGKIKISANRISSILERLYLEAQQFRSDYRLGLIGRTRLGHGFKWRLVELGYGKEFVDMATEGLLVYLHKPVAPIDSALTAAEARRTRRNSKRATDSHTTPQVVHSRDKPSTRYVELLSQYRYMHENGETFLNIKPENTFPGLSLPAQAHRIKQLIKETRTRRILDYGSGKGLQYELTELEIPGESGLWPSIREYWGIESITCYDPSYGPFSELPRGAYDGVISTDVLEHCPEPDIPWIIDEIFTYARKFVYMNIACYPAKKHLPTGENAHCTIKPKEWWQNIICDISGKHPDVRYEVWVQWREDQNIIEEVIRG